MRPELIETLREAQRFGFFGQGSIDAAALHALAFVDAVRDVADGARLVDLGSGGGLPGLVIADARPADSILLIDRRQKRTDFLERAVGRLGLTNVEVRCADVAALVADVANGDVASFDLVTARGFGPPATTVGLAAGLIGDGGWIVISEPPHADRWPPDLLAALGLVMRREGPVAVFAHAP